MAFKGHVEANWGFIGYPSLAILAVETIFQARSDKPEESGSGSQ